MSGSHNLQYLLVGRYYSKLKNKNLLVCPVCKNVIIEGAEIYSKHCNRSRKKIYHIDCARSVNVV